MARECAESWSVEAGTLAEALRLAAAGSGEGLGFEDSEPGSLIASRGVRGVLSASEDVGGGEREVGGSELAEAAEAAGLRSRREGKAESGEEG